MRRCFRDAIVFGVFCFATSTVFAQSIPLTQPNTGTKPFDQMTPAEQEQAISVIETQRQADPKPKIDVSKLATSPTDPTRMYCATYFKIGSIQADLTPATNDVVPGSDMTFTGVIRNQNNAPLVDGQLYVKIVFKGVDGNDYTQQSGSPVVDQFLVEDHINLKSQGEHPITVTWPVPSHASMGKYELATYYTSADRYNMLGLTFSDDIAGNTIPFSVTGTNPAAVAFDKASVTLNDQPFAFAAPPPHFTKDGPVMAHATLVNPSDQPKTVEVTWSLYSWDFIRSEYLRDSMTETVTLNPNEKKVLAHATKPIDDPVSLLVVQAKDQDVKSVLNIRFVRDGIQEARSNRLMMLDYPLRAGKQNALFGCVHSMSDDAVPGSTFTLSLKDMQGKLIHDYVYSGDISRNVMGFKNDFVPTQDLTEFTLTGTLTQPNRPTESVTLDYHCQDIDPSLCPVPLTWMDRLRPFLLVFSALLVVLLAGFGFSIWRRRRNQNT